MPNPKNIHDLHSSFPDPGSRSYLLTDILPFDGPGIEYEFASQIAERCGVSLGLTDAGRGEDEIIQKYVFKIEYRGESQKKDGAKKLERASEMFNLGFDNLLKLASSL